MVVLNEVKNMFWGVTLDGGKRYSQTVEHSFHISMAALEIKTDEGAGDKAQTSVGVMIQHEKAEFLFCTLSDKIPQCALDHNFSEGEDVTFFLNGSGVVHLTGYLMDDSAYDNDLPDDSALADEENISDEVDSEDESDDEEIDHEEIPNLLDDLGDEDSDDDEDFTPVSPTKSQKKRKKGPNGKELIPSKKAKTVAAVADEEEEDDDDDEESESEGILEDEKEEMSDDEDDSEDEVPAPKEVKKTSKKSEKKKNKSAQKLKVKDEVSKQKIGDTKSEGPQNGQSPTSSKKKKKGETPGKSKDDVDTPIPTPKTNKKKSEETPGKQQSKKTLPGGTVVEVISEGHGPEAKVNKTVAVYYRGALKQNGKIFDQCISGKPFKFKLGKGEVIKGWDTALLGMKVGGKRRVTVPPSQGYGNQRMGPIPPGSTLVFEIELKAVS